MTNDINQYELNNWWSRNCESMGLQLQPYRFAVAGPLMSLEVSINFSALSHKANKRAI